MKCPVCGKEAIPKKEYTCSVSGGVLEGSTSWDAMDCKNCGCQILLKERYPEDKK